MHGGNGYIEDFVTPRLLRDAQVLTVWEGTANILGLELLRLDNKFSVHLLFIDEMTERLDSVPESLWKLRISNAVETLAKDLTIFASLNPDNQTIEAKGLMRTMALLYEGVVALEWAEQHGGRHEKLMEIFIETNWPERTIGEVKSSVKYFSDVL